MNILIVEDNADIAANVGLYFENKGHNVDFAYNGSHGLNLALENNFDVIILDLMLPGMDGIQVSQHLKNHHPHNPSIIMLTARDTLDDKLIGFDAGADDYLVKPFSLLELEARVNALYKRGSNDTGNNVLKVADLELNQAEHTILRNKQSIQLKPVNFRILEFLLINQHRVTPQREIIDHVWKDSPPEGDPLRVHIHNIRQKIDKPFKHKLLHTIHGVGYRLYDDSIKPAAE
jgi:DNA-binding response OmpR family regulator